ncbi:DUF1810 family protein [Synechococcales cyanobacterium C]|uniref:DUF1810 family protein n=1 Tax=Petrachloros mirabilis ULC683 TaxID=2781853 RepID=A0A8K2A6A7_9CYAN|nr:DUF1810 domain-containing protein [Petrachloros mirabilis]NCJ05015.1 DUF1810 family protein [Petrachloros mirabilis ULC683]
MKPHSDSLERFIIAQEKESSYDLALRELCAGYKRSHWIWYILPQLRGLGRSSMSYQYGVADLYEAEAYLAHPVLGLRLIECVRAIFAHKDKSATQILGDLDAMKFRSCLTLFAAVAEPDSIFHEALAQFFESQPDPATLTQLDVALTPIIVWRREAQ